MDDPLVAVARAAAEEECARAERERARACDAKERCCAHLRTFVGADSSLPSRAGCTPQAFPRAQQ